MKNGVVTEVGIMLEFVNRVYSEEIKRIESIWQKVRVEINRPITLVNDWKDSVKNYLKEIKSKGKCELWSMEHYLQEARKVELEVRNFLLLDKDNIMARVSEEKGVCLRSNFSLLEVAEMSQCLSKSSNMKGKDTVRMNGQELPLIESVSVREGSMRNSLTELLYSQSVIQGYGSTCGNNRIQIGDHNIEDIPYPHTQSHELSEVQLKLNESLRKE